MSTPSEHTRLSLEERLGERARTAWPQLEQLHIHHRGAFAYVEADQADGERVKLMRLRYTGAVGRWGFAFYHACGDRYEDSLLPSGSATGTPADGLDCACQLHLAAPGIRADTGHGTASGVNPRRTSKSDHLGVAPTEVGGHARDVQGPRGVRGVL